MNRLQRLSFRTKLFFGITMVTICIVLLFSMMFYRYSISNMRRAEQQHACQVSESVSDQIDQMYGQMESACINLVYDEELQNAVTNLAFGKDLPDEQRQIYARTINASLQRTVLYLRNVVKVAIFNCEEDLYFFSGVFDTSVSYVNQRLADVQWYRNLFSKGEWQYFVAPRQSEWFQVPRPVVGIVRKFDQNADQNPAVLEIQVPYETLNTICSVSYTDKDSEVLVLDEEGKVVYPLEGSKALTAGQLEPLSQQVRQTSVPGTYSSADHRAMYSFCYSNYTGLSTVFVSGQTKITQQIRYFQALTCLLIFLVAGVMLVSFHVLIRRTTKPLNAIVSTLQRVDISNMSYQVPQGTQDEWFLLNNSIQQMLENLQSSFQHVYEARLRAMEAQVAMLQSQITPHFLYNTLNIIAIRCEDQQPETAAMCCQLSSLLRYAASTGASSVPIQAEVDYTQSYLQLMKMHYEELLCFSIHIPAALCGETIPKMTLQPFVENAINHGLEQVTPPWSIKIKGEVIGPGGWTITVQDNGSGMDEDILCRLQQECQNYYGSVLNGNLALDLNVGGIGILNTFARLCVYFKERTFFQMENLHPGFSITFGCLPEHASAKKEEENADKIGHCGG